MLFRGLFALLFCTACAVGPGGSTTVSVDTNKDGAVSEAPTRDRCGDTRVAPRVYFGSASPTLVPLSAGQLLAIASVGGSCSGTFISPEWVLTAKHCHTKGNVGVGSVVHVGPRSDEATIDFVAQEMVAHDVFDVMLLRVSPSAADVLPELAPIPIMKATMDSRYIGRLAEAAGFGSQENGGFGEREFTAEPIVRFESLSQVAGVLDGIVIDGEGERGVCGGDSGGPLFVLDDNGFVRIAGQLRRGDISCINLDRYTRTDIVASWIESHTGPLPTPQRQGCGNYTEAGRCIYGTAVWCDQGILRTQFCSEDCGLDRELNAQRCVPNDLGCGDISSQGSCGGNIARWCDRGVVRSRDCGACGLDCDNVTALGGVYCVDPCHGVPAGEGRCEGNIAQICFEGRISEVDCERRGETCGYRAEVGDYFCVPR